MEWGTHDAAGTLKDRAIRATGDGGPIETVPSLFDLAVDSKLRGCDLVRLIMSAPAGSIIQKPSAPARMRALSRNG